MWERNIYDMLLSIDLKLLEVIGTSCISTVYKACSKNSSRSYFRVKVIDEKKTGIDNLYDFIKNQEDNLKHKKFHDTIVPQLSRAETGKKAFIIIVSRYFEGITIAQLINSNIKSEKIINLNIFFKTASELGLILKSLQTNNHIHQGIKPDNIIISPNSHSLKLIDIVRTLSSCHIDKFYNDNDFCKNTLRYMAPEQTGRIAIPVTFATDIYSLGMVFYHMLTGVPAFISKNPLEIIHSHIAESPKSILALNHEVPLILNDLIFKMIEKEPGKRYQTAEEFLHDLKTCESQYNLSKTFTSFGHAFSEDFKTPVIITGREKECEILKKTHARVCNGSFQFVLVSGASGIGKTALVKELESHNTDSYFVSGKFDQNEQYSPYSSLIQAFKKIVNILLSKKTNDRKIWGEKIEKALNPNARLLTDLIPQLTSLIGKPDNVYSLSPIESKNRFNTTIKNFISCIAEIQAPLVIFIDDLQWADSATIEILKDIISNPADFPFFMLTGAYRHDEIDSKHHLNILLDIAKKRSDSFKEIKLLPLKESDVKKITANTLNTTSDIRFLTISINKISEGNPLYVNEVIDLFYKNRVIYMDEQGKWKFDLESIKKLTLPDIASDLFKNKVDSLPQETLLIVQKAACIGIVFSDNLLAALCKIQVSELHIKILPVFNLMIFVKQNTNISFFHDKIHEAVLATIDGSDEKKIHYEIAKILLNQTDKKKINSAENIFKLAEHINRGKDCIKNTEDFISCAYANYHAGEKAYKALALDAADNYFTQAHSFLEKNCWEKNYDLTFKIYKSITMSKLATGSQKQAKEFLSILIKKTKTDIEKAACFAQQAKTLVFDQAPKDVIAAGNRCLKYFNMEILEDDHAALSKCKDILSELYKENIFKILLEKKPVKDEKYKIIMAVLADIIPPYYLTGKVNQLFLAGATSVMLAAKWGVNEAILYAFPAIALYHQLSGEFDLAFKYEDIVFDFCDRYPNTFGAVKGINGILFVLCHNRKDPDTVIDLCRKNISMGIRCGDLYNGGLSYVPLLFNIIAKCESFKNIDIYIDDSLNYAEKYNIPRIRGMFEAVKYGWADQEMYTDYDFNEKDAIKKWEKNGDILSIGVFLTLCGIQKYFLSEYEAALKYLKDSKEYISGLTDSLLYRLWYVFYPLTILCLKKKNNTDSKNISPETDGFIKQLEIWAALGPVLVPYLLFIRAEHARCYMDKDFKKVRDLYFNAIDFSKKHGYNYLCAKIYERLATLFKKENSSYADFYFLKAVDLYKKTGAQTCAAKLNEKYFTKKEKTADPFLKVDAAYLINASQAISQKTDINSLLKIIIQSVMERCGAQNGYLMINTSESGLILKVIGYKEENFRIELRDEPLSNDTPVPVSVLNYVKNYKKPLILDDAAAFDPFSNDKTVKKFKPKSILCQPLINQNKLTGIIYLENRMISSAFSEQQTELVKHLAYQAAISLENAGLISNLNFAKNESLKLNEQLKLKNRELEQIIYVTSHDLRSPLVNVQGFVKELVFSLNDIVSIIENESEGSLIKKELIEIIDEDIPESISYITASVQKMDTLLKGLLELSRLGKAPLNIKLVDMSAEIKFALNSYEFQIKEKHIEINIDTLPSAYCDSIQMNQVLSNLIGNAIKYLDPERPGKIDIFASKEKDFNIYSIKDNGIGVSAEYSKKIFEIFYRINSDRNEGDGLGLSIITKILGRVGGSIWIEDTIDIGAVFSFSLPNKLVS